MLKHHLRKLYSHQFRTVKAKTLFVLLPAFVATLLLLAGFSYLFSERALQKEIQEKMDLQFKNVSAQISSSLSVQSMLPELVARNLEGQAKSYTLSQYQEILSKSLGSNKDAFGVGIFFEPYKYATDKQFFSTYAHWDGDNIVTTEQYSDPSYNYPLQDWYKGAREKKEISTPYYDPGTDTTMVTFALPFFDQQKSLLGVVTSDLNLQKIQQFVEAAKVGQNGWAILLDEQGNYIGGPDADKIMKVNISQDDNAQLAKAADKLLNSKQGTLTLKNKGETYRMYHEILPETGWVLGLAISEDEMFSPLSQLLFWTSIISMIGIAIGAASVLFYIRIITGNLRKVNLLSESLASGDFTREIIIEGKDEFAAMGSNLNSMTATMKDLLGQISLSASRVTDTSLMMTNSAGECSKITESVVLSIQEVAAGSEAQMISTEEAAKAMEEMAAGVQRIADSSLGSARTADEIIEQAQLGNKRMQEAALFLRDMEEQSAETMELVQSLGRHSTEVGSITGFITEISSQTNLLALNAAIEAARVGEHGRGFAVVAQEVKKLAERSEEAAKGIFRLVSEIQQENGRIVTAMEQSSEKVQSGAALVGEAEQAFQEIMQGLDNITMQIHEISSSSQQLMAGAEEITSSVDQLAHIATSTSEHAQMVAASSEEQLAAMEEVAASAAELNQMAESQLQLASRFKVGG